MSPSPGRRRAGRTLASLVWLPVAAAVAAGAWAVGAGPAGADSIGEEDSFEATEDDPLGYVVDLDALDEPAVIAAGRELYEVGCVSCHLSGGRGGDRGPTIVDAGAASAHFYLTSGRMPLANPGQAHRKDPAYAPDEITALVAYVAALGDGPPIPVVELDEAELAEGGELYRLHCAACHQAAGAGGALSYGNNAPSLVNATPVQIVEAMIIGPGQMPVFEQLTDEEREAITLYVLALRDVEDPGGLSLGRVGPIPEGFVAIIIGLGATLLAALWIGRRRTDQAHDEASVHAATDRAPA